MTRASRIPRRTSSRLLVALIVLACLVGDAAIALASNPGESVGLQYMYTYHNCTSSSVVDPINVVWEGGEPSAGNVDRVLAHHGWSHNDYKSPIIKYAHLLGLGGVDSQYVHETDGHCYRDGFEAATGNPIGNRNHVRLFGTYGSGRFWVVGDAHHDQVESACTGPICNQCTQAIVGGHITSSFNQGREALKNAWPSSSRFVNWGNTFEITQCNGEKKHSDGKVLYLNSNIAGIAGYDPENIEEPTISGTPQVGYTLTVHPGTWTGNPGSYVYQWCRVEPSEDSCTPYSGATGATWTAPTGSGGSVVGVMVRPAGSDEADEVLSQVVQVAPPSPSPPSVTLDPTTERMETQALLGDSVNPNGSDTHYYFQYGQTTGYGNTLPAYPGTDIGSGTSPVYCSNTVEHLHPGTTYHYRIVASNGGGTTYGSDQTFTTPNEGVQLAVQGSNHTLDFWSAYDNQPFVEQTIGGAGSTYGSPSMVRFNSKYGTGVQLLVEGANHTLDFYSAYDNQAFSEQTVGGVGSTYGTPSLVRFSDEFGTGLQAAVQGPNHTLDFWSAFDNQAFGEQTIAGEGSTYGNPSVVRFKSAYGTGVAIAVQGPNNALDFYSAFDNHPFSEETIGGAGSTYGAPSMVRFNSSYGTGFQILVEGANHTLDLYSAYDNQPFSEQTVGGEGSTYGNPSAVRFNSEFGTGLQAVVQGANHTLDYYGAFDNQPFTEQTIAGEGSTYGNPSAVRFSSECFGNGLQAVVQGANNTLDYYGAFDNEPFSEQTVAGAETTFGDPSAVRIYPPSGAFEL